MKRYCLIIEDDDKTVSYHAYERNIKKREGIELEIISLDPSISEFQKETENDIIINKEKLNEKLTEILKRRIDLVACDFDLSDNNINGLDVIRMIKQIKPNKRIFLFSGKLNKIVKTLLSSNDKDEIFKNIKTLINSKISDFIDRDNELIEDAIIKNLKNHSWEEELNNVFD
ncbi:MAG: hypothetical protein JXL97_04545 [Bacteroidales bacterium]|nr:hypothetical protein [Bacteroidales bacterium]